MALTYEEKRRIRELALESNRQYGMTRIGYIQEKLAEEGFYVPINETIKKYLRAEKIHIPCPHGGARNLHGKQNPAKARKCGLRPTRDLAGFTDPDSI